MQGAHFPFAWAFHCEIQSNDWLIGFVFRLSPCKGTQLSAWPTKSGEWWYLSVHHNIRTDVAPLDNAFPSKQPNTSSVRDDSDTCGDPITFFLYQCKRAKSVILFAPVMAVGGLAQTNVFPAATTAVKGSVLTPAASMKGKNSPPWTSFFFVPSHCQEFVTSLLLRYL